MFGGDRAFENQERRTPQKNGGHKEVEDREGAHERGNWH